MEIQLSYALALFIELGLLACGSHGFVIGYHHVVEGGERTEAHSPKKSPLSIVTFSHFPIYFISPKGVLTNLT